VNIKYMNFSYDSLLWCVSRAQNSEATETPRSRYLSRVSVIRHK